MKQKIAIIEDESSIVKMYKFKLEQTGYEVRYALNGAAGWKLIQEFRPTLILLDLLMPEMNGDEMLEKIRATDWGKTIKVIILTNISKDEVSSKLRDLGIDRYIIKALYTPSQVVTLVSELLAKKKSS